MLVGIRIFFQILIKIFVLYFVLQIYGLLGICSWIWKILKSIFQTSSSNQNKKRKVVAITGGRSPFTLELVRLMNKRGHKVIILESIPLNLCAFSRLISKSYSNLPKPAKEPLDYIKAVTDILEKEQIDLLIPTCEEVFYLSKGMSLIKKGAPQCQLFFEDISILRELHNKWIFAELVREQQNTLHKGVKIPATYLINSEKELYKVFEKNIDLVLKPCYSRFATQTIIKPNGIKDKRVQAVLADLKLGISWVAQHYISGKHYSSYSVVQVGTVVVHSCYPSEFTPGVVGATMVFESVKHAIIEDWVKSLVRIKKLTGQYAFDFIEGKDSVYVLECNPRSSNGIHLFAEQPELCDRFLEGSSFTSQPTLVPLSNQSSRQIAAAMVFINYFSLSAGPGKTPGKFWNELRKWIVIFLKSKDVVFDLTDPIPFFMQFILAAIFTVRGFVNGVNAVQSTTLDIEWNGN